MIQGEKIKKGILALAKTLKFTTMQINMAKLRLKYNVRLGLTREGAKKN
jgi:hypothetical protein